MIGEPEPFELTHRSEAVVAAEARQPEIDVDPLCPRLQMPVLFPLGHGCGVFQRPASVRGRIRTCNLLLRREPLCPIELRGPVFCAVHPAGIEPAPSG